MVAAPTPPYSIEVAAGIKTSAIELPAASTTVVVRRELTPPNKVLVTRGGLIVIVVGVVEGPVVVVGEAVDVAEVRVEAVVGTLVDDPKVTETPVEPGPQA